jgi:hypothetical protein
MAAMLWVAVAPTKKQQRERHGHHGGGGASGEPLEHGQSLESGSGESRQAL